MAFGLLKPQYGFAGFGGSSGFAGPSLRDDAKDVGCEGIVFLHQFEAESVTQAFVNCHTPYHHSKGEVAFAAHPVPLVGQTKLANERPDGGGAFEGTNTILRIVREERVEVTRSQVPLFVIFLPITVITTKQ